MASILDVVDNFFGDKGSRDILQMPGSTLYELGKEIRRFNTAQSPPSINKALHPVYLGGWPSANFWLADQGDLVMSSLLYCGQVLAKDPLSNWFAPEQYKLSHKMATRPGYISKDEDGKPAVRETRQFLSVVVPALQRLRPLIERGVLVLAPSEAFLVDEHQAVDDLTSRLAEKLEPHTMDIVQKFTPLDLAVEDNVRGMFIFAGGEREKQLRQSVASAAQHFAREYVIATLHEVNYVAPFPFEQYICEQGLDKVLLQAPGEKIVHALLSSPLPLYSGLTPAVVADVRDDDNYAEFRAQLYNLYRDLSVHANEEDAKLQLAEAEETLLRRPLERAQANVERGVLGRMRIAATDVVMKFGVSMALGTAYSPDRSLLEVAGETGLREGLEKLGRALRGKQPSGDPVTVWQKLYAHNRAADEELQRIASQPGQNQEGPKYWGIPEKPSMDVTVSTGAMIIDYFPEFDKPQGSESDVYRDCECGSGRKYKFCCRDLEQSL